eukprot:837700_1
MRLRFFPKIKTRLSEPLPYVVFGPFYLNNLQRIVYSFTIVSLTMRMRYCTAIVFLIQWIHCQSDGRFESTTSTTGGPIQNCKSVELNIDGTPHEIPTDACFNTVGVFTAEPQSAKFVCNDHGEAHLLIFEDGLDCAGTPTSPQDPCAMHGPGCKSTSYCEADPCTYVYLEVWQGAITQCSELKIQDSIKVTTGVSVPDVYDQYYSVFRMPWASEGCEDDDGGSKVTSYCETDMIVETLYSDSHCASEPYDVREAPVGVMCYHQHVVRITCVVPSRGVETTEKPKQPKPKQPKPKQPKPKPKQPGQPKPKQPKQPGQPKPPMQPQQSGLPKPPKQPEQQAVSGAASPHMIEVPSPVSDNAVVTTGFVSLIGTACIIAFLITIAVLWKIKPLSKIIIEMPVAVDEQDALL